MPVLPWVAYPPKTWVKSKQSVSYTSIWNLLNYSALAIPAIVADKELDKPTEEWMKYEPKNDSDKFNKEQCKWIYLEDKDEVLTLADDLELVHGMPVGLQIITGRFGEEKAVGIAKLIETLRLQTSKIA